jgi:hypothetical protein
MYEFLSLLHKITQFLTINPSLITNRIPFCIPCKYGGLSNAISFHSIVKFLTFKVVDYSHADCF